jgi:hypothetical protein
MDTGSPDMSEIARQHKAGRYERVGRLIYGIQRIGGTEGLRGLKADRHVTSDTAERGAALADRCDMLYACFMSKLDEVGDADVQALLDEVAELMKEVTRQHEGG